MAFCVWLPTTSCIVSSCCSKYRQLAQAVVYALGIFDFVLFYYNYHPLLAIRRPYVNYHHSTALLSTYYLFVNSVVIITIYIFRFPAGK